MLICLYIRTCDGRVGEIVISVFKVLEFGQTVNHGHSLLSGWTSFSRFVLKVQLTLYCIVYEH